MRVRGRLLWLALAVALGAAVFALMGAVPADHEIPPFPNAFSGMVFVGGDPAPPGLQLVACVGGCDNWESQPVSIQDGGQYSTLVAGPPHRSDVGGEITFWIVTDFGRVQAVETSRFSSRLSDLVRTLDLRFTSALPTPPPTPTPTPPPPTPTPTPTPTPLPPPALPIPGEPLVPQLAKVALYGSIAVLVVGAVGLYWARRRVQ